MTFDPLQLPEVRAWIADAGAPAPGLFDYVGQTVGATGTLAVAGLLWPRLLQVDGCILIEDRYESANFSAWKQKGLSSDQIEDVINHIHLWDVFADIDDVPEAALDFLGHVMAATWRLAAERAFPKTGGITEYSNEPNDYGPTVSMRSRRHAETDDRP